MSYPILAECEQVGDGYRHTCGETLVGKRVTHPIWFRELGPCTGFGEVDVEVVPYCPKCGPEPSSHGSPVYGKWDAL